MPTPLYQPGTPVRVPSLPAWHGVSIVRRFREPDPERGWRYLVEYRDRAPFPHLAAVDAAEIRAA